VVEKLDVVEAVIAWVRERRAEGLKYGEIDQLMGFPRKWGGRVSWNIAKRPRQEWEAVGTAPEPKPEPVVAAVREDPSPYAQPTASSAVPRFCSACGTALAGPFCSACGTRAISPSGR
jgi:hypothetical protein